MCLVVRVKSQNITDAKIGSKAIALRLQIILPSIIHYRVPTSKEELYLMQYAQLTMYWSALKDIKLTVEWSPLIFRKPLTR